MSSELEAPYHSLPVTVSMPKQKKRSPGKGIQISLESCFSPVKKKPRKQDFNVYVNLEGVLTDFDAGVEQLYGCKPAKMTETLTNRMWMRIGGLPWFFRYLPWTRDGKELWVAIQRLKPDILAAHTCIAEAPNRKYEWCQRELGVETFHAKYVDGPREVGVSNVITCHEEKNKHHEMRECDSRQYVE